MKLFKSVGILIEAWTGVLVHLSEAADEIALATKNVGTMGKMMSQEMLDEQKEEAKKNLAALKAS